MCLSVLKTSWIQLLLIMYYYIIHVYRYVKFMMFFGRTSWYGKMYINDHQHFLVVYPHFVQNQGSDVGDLSAEEFNYI